MKHIILTVVLLINTLGFAQNNKLSQRSVTVYGSATTTSNASQYKCQVTLSLDNSYYTDTPCATIEELKAKYFNELQKNDVDTKKFEEDELAYAGMGYRKDGLILQFITDDKEEMIKMASTKLAQVNASYIQVKDNSSPAETQKRLEEAMTDALKNAKTLAKLANSKVGKVISISSYSMGYSDYWRSANAKPEALRLTVVYELVD